MTRHRITVAAALLLVLAAGPAAAEDPAVGQVKTATGEAALVRGDQRLPATPGVPVRTADRIVTGKNGAVGVTFTDDTRISVGPDTDFRVESYAFSPKDQKLGFASHLAKGTLQFVSGGIARLAPQTVAITTPSGTLGVRGTNFVVKVEE